MKSPCCVLLLATPAYSWAVGTAAGRQLAASRLGVARAPHPCVRMGILDRLFGEPQDDERDGQEARGEYLDQPMKLNKYFDQVVNISAPELVQNFAQTAPPEVQQAVRTTVMGLFGGLPSAQFETTITSTSQNVASLMYSMQMTGYMFQNAAYRLSLKKSLDRAVRLLPGEIAAEPAQRASAPSDGLPVVSGTIAVDMGAGSKVEVDAAAYVADLHNEVAALKSALARAEERPAQDAGSGALLAYMQSLPREQVQDLSRGISPEVLECMQMLIEAVLSRDTAVLGGLTVVESSGVKLRELLVWQLITGYKLRELEQRDELNKLFAK